MKRVIIVLGIILAFQVVFAELNLHSVNPYVDRLIHYTPELVCWVLISLLMVIVRRANFHKAITFVATGILVITTPITGCVSLITAVKVAESRIEVEKRMYIETQDGWVYYAHTLRRSALDDLWVDVLKEKPLAFGLTVRKIVHKDELPSVGTSVDSVHARYLRYYVGNQ